MRIFTYIGKKVIEYLEILGGLVILFVKAILQIKNGIRPRLLFLQMAHLGVDTLPIVALTMLFTGMVITLQTTMEFIRLGAQSTIGGIVFIAIARELGPVLCSVIMAGRVGSAITAEISTMKVTEQIDALKVMAVNPINYLVVPRMISCFFMLPILILFGDVIGTFGGFFVANQFDISFNLYFNSITTYAVFHDSLGGLYKGFIFGIIIALVGSFYGLNAKDGAIGVGIATTKSVVISIILIFFTNCILSLLIYK